MPNRPVRSGLRATVAGAVLAVALSLAGAAYAKESPSPSAAAPGKASLAIGVTDGVDRATPGDTLNYTVTVHNHGPAASGAVNLKLTLPGGVTLASADHSGKSGPGGVVSWSLTVPAAGQVVVVAHATVGTPDAQAKGLAAVACVDGTEGLLCSSDIDQIPGRADVHAITGTQQPTTPLWRHWWMIATAVTGLLALLAVGGYLVLRRRIRPRMSA
jgi:uncharacterized repeat protein (TIGR01451 family)